MDQCRLLLTEMHHDPAFYESAHGIKKIPSAETPRQRMDAIGSILRSIIPASFLALLTAPKI